MMNGIGLLVKYLLDYIGQGLRLTTCGYSQEFLLQIGLT